MWLGVSSTTWSDLEIGDYTRRYLVDNFSNVKGVGRILVAVAADTVALAELADILVAVAAHGVTAELAAVVVRTMVEQVQQT